MDELFKVITHRKEEPVEGSYTCYLFNKGLDKILKKVGEEASETIIAAKNGEKQLIIEETADLLYHLMVMLKELSIEWEDVQTELKLRAEKIGNLKTIGNVDKAT